MAEATSSSGSPDAPVSAPDLMIIPPPRVLDPDATPAVAKEEPKAAEPEKEAAAEDEPKATEEDGPDRDPKTGRFAKREAQIKDRINDLTAQKYAVQREVEALAKRKADLEKALGDEPKIAPDDYAAQETHRIRTALKTESLEQTKADLEAAQQRANDTRSATFRAKVEAAQERIPDLLEVLGSEVARTLPLSPHAEDVIAESPLAAELSYHLIKNPQTAIRIASLSPAQQGAELARIEAQLKAAPQVRKTTKAPEPAPTLGGSRSPAVRDPADMSVEELQKFLTPHLGRRH